jgi:hypothetical protein
VVQKRLSKFDEITDIRERCASMGLKGSEFRELAYKFIADINACNIPSCSMKQLTERVLNDGIG